MYNEYKKPTPILKRIIIIVALALACFIAFLASDPRPTPTINQTTINYYQTEPTHTAVDTPTPTAAPQINTQCPSQNEQSAGHHQLLAIRGLDPNTITAVSFQMLDCNGLPLEFEACDLDPHKGSCFALMPRIPHSSQLYIKIDSPTRGSITPVDPNAPFWEIDFSTTVEEILPDNFWSEFDQ